MLLVVCHYMEDISWLRNTEIKSIVYDKKKGENIGRESEVFVRYILENYDNLPETVVFLQGNPFDHCSDLWEKIKNYQNGILFLGSLTTDDINGHPYLGINLEEYLNKYVSPDIKDTEFTFAAGAQYIVPRENILNKPKEFWEKLHRAHWEHDKFPWIIERLWPLIWNYNPSINRN